MILLADLEKTHELAWSEDDAAPHSRDHEGPHSAMLRLGRSWEELEEAKAAGRHEGFDVHGDCEAYELDDGAILVLSWPGNSALWVVKRRVSRIGRPPRVEITCELGFEDGHALTHAEAKEIEAVLRAAVARTFPHDIRACWVHRAPKYLGKGR